MADLEALQTFVVAVRAGSFAHAARQSRISPAMVGRRIRALEESYGLRLIERTTRRQRLTEAGAAFLLRAEAVLDAAAELDELASPDGAQLRGRIRLSGPTTLGIKRLPPILARFTQQHPEVIFEMSLSDRRVDLVEEGFDLAVRVGHLPPSAMIARRIGTYGFVCVAAPEHIMRFGAPQHPDNLAGQRCVLNLNLVPRNRWPFLNADGSPFTVVVRGSMEIDNGEALREAALAGAGIAYVPQDLVAEDLQTGRLRQVLSDWPLPSLPIHAVHPSRKLVPRRVSAFIETLAQEMNHRSAQGAPPLPR
jgi:DNA-binding transcriptional LysR family regulator